MAFQDDSTRTSSTMALAHAPSRGKRPTTKQGKAHLAPHPRLSQSARVAPKNGSLSQRHQFDGQHPSPSKENGKASADSFRTFLTEASHCTSSRLGPLTHRNRGSALAPHLHLMNQPVGLLSALVNPSNVGLVATPLSTTIKRIPRGLATLRRIAFAPPPPMPRAAHRRVLGRSLVDTDAAR